MKDIELHKFLGKISRALEEIREKTKDESISKEIYEIRREILKQMIRIEKKTWEEERKKHANVM